MKSTFIRWVAFSAIALGINCASAISFSDSDERHVISLTGEIRKGDADLYANEVVRRFDNRSYPTTLLLNSPGGDVLEAMKIGQLVRAFGSSVRVAKNGVCASSCFFIFVSANRRIASGALNGGAYKSRSSGRVGLHRPYFSGDSLNSVGPDKAIEQQRQLMVQIGDYLKKENVSQKLIDEMMARSSKEIYWMTQQDLDGLGKFSPGYEEILVQRCSYSKQWEAKLNREYDAAESRGDKKKMKQLDGEFDTFSECKGDVDDVFRDRGAEIFVKLKSGWRPWR